jgi:pyruvate/2-oxoglutarate dehydrogenase complex dihydrolipoamide dehydrogenase (E3) component
LDVPDDGSKKITVEYNDDKFTVSYDYLVISTGSQYKMPIKDVDATEMLERTIKLKEHIEGLEGDSVLVVGGGINGVEYATEL